MIRKLYEYDFTINTNIPNQIFNDIINISTRGKTLVVTVSD